MGLKDNPAILHDLLAVTGDLPADRFPRRFWEAAIKEIAQGAYAKNASVAFVDLPEALMADAEWAWNAGYLAGHFDCVKPESKRAKSPHLNLQDEE